MKYAIVHGAAGRVGKAFFDRLKRDGYATYGIVEEPVGPLLVDMPDRESVHIFVCAYRAGHDEELLVNVANMMSNWRTVDGIFVPSSMWIGTDSAYGRAKLVIEQMAKFYNGLGANIVTDRIGYFPGDGVEPNPADPFIDKLVTGDELYARVMKAMGL